MYDYYVKSQYDLSSPQLVVWFESYKLAMSNAIALIHMRYYYVQIFAQQKGNTNEIPIYTSQFHS